MIGRLRSALWGFLAALGVLVSAVWFGWTQRGAKEDSAKVKRRLETRENVEGIENDVQALDDDALADRLSRRDGL